MSSLQPHPSRPWQPTRLVCPGPTPVPMTARLAQADEAIYHRQKNFRNILLECRERLHPFFGTKTPSQEKPLILTCSGTGAMEACVQHFTDPDDVVAVINGGKFGRRWVQMNQEYGCEVIEIRVEAGFSLSNDHLIQNCLNKLPAGKRLKALFLQASETSTGVFHPLNLLLPVFKKNFPDAFVVLDAVSALGAHSIEQELWGIDAVISGSQKSLGSPPGLAILNLSPKAWAHEPSRPRFYFDLKKERKAQEEGNTAFTPATGLVMAMLANLRAMQPGEDPKTWPQAVESFIQNHKRLGEGVRQAARAMNLTLFAQDHPCHACTSILLEPPFSAPEILKRLHSDFNATFAGGQDELKGRIIRIAHLGFVTEWELMGALGALEMTLARLYPDAFAHPGAGVAAACAFWAFQ